jgi:hypothetical protein
MSFFAVCTLRRALRSNLSHLISFYFNIIFIMPVITRSQSWKLSHTTKSSQQSEYSTRSQVESLDISSLLPLHST